MPLPRVKLNLSVDPGENRIEVDGHDITNKIAGVQVGRVAGEPFTHVTLHLRAEAEIDSDLAEVIAVADTGGAAKSLVELLDQVDPKVLEKQALDRLGSLDGGDMTVGQAFVETLKEWAQD